MCPTWHIVPGHLEAGQPWSKAKTFSSELVSSSTKSNKPWFCYLGSPCYVLELALLGRQNSTQFGKR